MWSVSIMIVVACPVLEPIYHVKNQIPEMMPWINVENYSSVVSSKWLNALINRFQEDARNSRYFLGNGTWQCCMIAGAHWQNITMLHPFDCIVFFFHLMSSCTSRVWDFQSTLPTKVGDPPELEVVWTEIPARQLCRSPVDEELTACMDAMMFFVS